MPTYTVTATTGSLGPDVRQRIASAITATHHSVTGAQSFFAQVIFVAVEPADWFIGGAPVAPGSLFVHGQIRAGRPASIRSALLTGLLDATANSARVPRSRVWVYLVELPAAHMAEYGHVLPEPGSEAQWLASLPPADRAVMEATGTRAASSNTGATS